MERIKTGCIEHCPGCAHRNLSMKASLLQKENWLKTKLSDFADAFQPIHTVSEEKRWNYRGKVCLHTAFGGRTWQFGMMKRDELIDIPACPVHSSTVLKCIAVLREVLPESSCFPMAYYFHSQAQLTLVLKTKQFPDISWLTEDVKQVLKDAGVEGLSLHLNPSAGRRLFEKWGWHQLFGVPYSKDQYGMVYGRTSFHQLIPQLYHQSFDEAEEFLSPNSQTSVIDLYCGMGNSLFRWEKRGAKAIGIESGAEAVTCAKINAPGAEVLLGTCERRIPQLEAWRLNRLEETPDTQFLLYTNPPRTGMEQKVTSWIVENLKPQRIAYLSCSAGTLKRDLDILVNNGYTVKSIIPFDFFPQTYHAECLVLLESIRSGTIF